MDRLRLQGSSFNLPSNAKEMSVDESVESGVEPEFVIVEGFKVAVGAMVLEPQEFLNGAIIGVNEHGALIYDYEAVVELYARESGWRPDVDSAANTELYGDAVEYVNYHTVREAEYFTPLSLRAEIRGFDSNE